MNELLKYRWKGHHIEVLHSRESVGPGKMQKCLPYIPSKEALPLLARESHAQMSQV